ncbi:MAG: thioredoxin domain-containing protein [Ancrocorticia sp.]
MSSNRQSNNERLELKARALRAQAEAEETKRRRRKIILVLVAVLVLVIGIVAAFMLGNSKDDEEAGSATGQATSAGILSERGGIVVGASGILPPPDGQEQWTTESIQALASDTTVVVSIYTDYMCPACGLFEQVNSRAIESMVQSGQIILDLHSLGMLDGVSQGTNYSTRSAAASLYVADNDPEHFLAFNTALFTSQPKENTPGLTDAELADVARQAGVNEDVAKVIGEGGAPQDSIANNTNMAAEDLGRLATPTIVLNGTTLDPYTYDWRKAGVFEQAVKDAAAAFTAAE